MREADLHLTDAQGIRITRMFATEPALVRRMTFTNVAQSLHRFIASRPTQSCLICSSDHMTQRPILRSQLLGWRFTCAVCGHLLRDESGHQRPSPFKQYRGAALRGEKLLDDEAERGTGTWTSPAEIARLLLMRRVPRPFTTPSPANDRASPIACCSIACAPCQPPLPGHRMEFVWRSVVSSAVPALREDCLRSIIIGRDPPVPRTFSL